ncbi:MAG: 5-(carboxyamino)imidazole ribonucleotide synthase [Rhizobiaceae bacterium]
MSLPAGSTIGMLGGGQLARMMCMAAARLGYKTLVYDPDVNAPAAQVANDHVVANYDDVAELEVFARTCDVVTYEFENVPVSAAKVIDAITPVRPGVQALEAAQDRFVEKTFLNKAGILTAPFATVDNDHDLRAALLAFGGNGVLKTRRLGYDGKGQKVLRQPSDESIAGTHASFGSVPLILEGFIAFEREVSVIAARGLDGKVAICDPAENIHRDGILHSSTVPARLGDQTLEAAKTAAIAILESLDYVGVVGVEFFALADGSLIANEIAPRVHNSGHWTEAACAISQFEQHIRAVAGLPLGDPKRHSNCVMENLIGEDIEKIADLCAESDVVVHHYGKTETRAGRKMGHFTRLSPLK